MNIRPAILSTLLLAGLPAAGKTASELWGERGERWTPESRLPDFSFAGYRCGEASPPRRKVVANVRDFGAKGDGRHDDIDAFRRAVEATDAGAILVPAGRYLLSDVLWIEKPGITLLGEGPDRTVLYFPKMLEDVRPNMSATTYGRPTSGYSWSGGFVWVRGHSNEKPLADVAKPARRGSNELVVRSAARLRVGQRIVLKQTDDAEKTFVSHLYAGDPGDVSKIVKPIRLRFVARIAALSGRHVRLDRPLRTDVRLEWQPKLAAFEPSVHDVGIENLAFEFPVTPYEGHFTERGRNALAFSGVADSWVRDLCIRNADSGIFFSGSWFCSASHVLFESERPAKKGCTGHHGIEFGTDCLLEDFDFRTHFIHDLTMGYLSAGNVVKNGRGIDLSFDHHRMCNHENLFCNLDVGEGDGIWRCGGGRALGRHCGARGTFWAIRSRQPIRWPPNDFGPDLLNLVGLETDQKPHLDPGGRWFEPIPPERLRPADLHAAQLRHRLHP